MDGVATENSEKWSRVESDNPTNVIYGKEYRVERPDGGEKLVDTRSEMERYLRLWYGQDGA